MHKTASIYHAAVASGACFIVCNRLSESLVARHPHSTITLHWLDHISSSVVFFVEALVSIKHGSFMTKVHRLTFAGSCFEASLEHYRAWDTRSIRHDYVLAVQHGCLYVKAVVHVLARGIKSLYLAKSITKYAILSSLACVCVAEISPITILLRWTDRRPFYWILQSWLQTILIFLGLNFWCKNRHLYRDCLNGNHQFAVRLDTWVMSYNFRLFVTAVMWVRLHSLFGVIREHGVSFNFFFILHLGAQTVLIAIKNSF